jgi:hypothetical protein
MALYMHLGPFSKNVIGEIDRRIAQLGEADRVSAAEVVTPVGPMSVPGQTEKNSG